MGRQWGRGGLFGTVMQLDVRQGARVVRNGVMGRGPVVGQGCGDMGGQDWKGGGAPYCVHIFPPHSTTLSPHFTPHSLQVEYPPRPGSEDWYYVQYAVSDLHELQPAWCMTVHKSQGAEYPCVLVALHHEAGESESVKVVVRIGFLFR